MWTWVINELGELLWLITVLIGLSALGVGLAVALVAA